MLPLGILVCWAACSLLGAECWDYSHSHHWDLSALPWSSALTSNWSSLRFIRWKMKSTVLVPEICGYILCPELNSAYFLSGQHPIGQVFLFISFLLFSYKASSWYFKGERKCRCQGEGQQGSQSSQVFGLFFLFCCFVFCFKSPSFPL